MTFQLPEDLSALDASALSALLATAQDEIQILAAVPDADLTDEQLSGLESLLVARDSINAEDASRQVAAQERTDRLAAVRSQVDETPVTPEPVKEPVADPPADEETIVIPDDASELLEENQEVEAVTAAAKRPVVSRAASHAPEPVQPVPAPVGTLIASVDVPGFEGGSELADSREVAKAFMARARAFQSNTASRPKGVDRFDRYGVSKIQKPENEFTIRNESPEEQIALIKKATDERRLPGGSLAQSALTAAVTGGGWCAPSTTMYGFCSMETVDGILDIPTIDVPRGGINFTKGPDYGTLAADWGFLQTETQAEAATVKTCYTIDCPDFTEVRLDAIGFCVTSPVLTNAAYPELVRRVLEIGGVAHQHKVNAHVLSALATSLGTAIDWGESGATTSDLLGGLELNAERLRYNYSLAIASTLEVVLPAWARTVVRADLATREGVDLLSVTDAQITAYFAIRGMAVQWVYDWQPLSDTNTGTGKNFPATVTAMIYPAGAFVKGTTDVIDLDTVYDSTGLSTNLYTAAFFEEGLLVANTCAGGYQVAIALNVDGATGFPAVGAGAGVTFASA